MHSRTSLIILLAVALTFSSNISAQSNLSSQSQISSPSFATPGGSPDSDPLLVEMEGSEDDEEPMSVIQEGNHPQDGSSSTITRDRGFIDQEFPMSGPTNTSESSNDRRVPKEAGHHMEQLLPEDPDIRNKSQTGSEEEPDEEDGEPIRYTTQTNKHESSHVNGEVRVEIMTGTDNNTSAVPSESYVASDPTQSGSSVDVQTGLGDQEENSPHGPPHEEESSKSGVRRGSGSTEDGGAVQAHPIVAYPITPGSVDNSKKPYTTRRPAVEETPEHEDDDGQSSPTRTTDTSYSGTGGHPAGYPGVPAGDKVYCQGPLDPTTGEGIIDISGSCTIACYNNLVLNQAGDNCVCPPTMHLEQVHARCVCRSPYVLSNGKCVLPPSQRAQHHSSGHKKRSMIPQTPIGPELLHGKYLRTEKDMFHCPPSEIACPLPSGGFECLDPEFSLDSCGGCSSDGTGADCWQIEGASGVGCNAGSCLVFSCLSGFDLVENACISNISKKV
ncbi:hypothetical protein CROQUDRAFT_92447 [Cronartium quercuum f. sp. fusiforme G11]|uniref:Protein CPL1-like domain-containing protein n=1 Tax=Cronartium quercuum f. sp. fusiforme G11 TaxID=708437 RepID=A0A9P6NGP9_9BASI|nr:hypothetical protein CROQUDRAFT_92447 [Cronartium quercuum f. sp. fusiforme G11]